LKRPYELLGPCRTRDDADKLNIPNSALSGTGTIPVIMTGTGDRPDSGILMYILRKAGLERLLIESPSYTNHLMGNRSLDEYFINYSMVYAGGTLTPGYGDPFSSRKHPHAKLLSLSTHGCSFLYTRQKLYYDIEQSVDFSGMKY
jgi:hypothetical protein